MVNFVPGCVLLHYQQEKYVTISAKNDSDDEDDRGKIHCDIKAAGKGNWSRVILSTFCRRPNLEKYEPKNPTHICGGRL
jgi:hypothetical protein